MGDQPPAKAPRVEAADEKEKKDKKEKSEKKEKKEKKEKDSQKGDDALAAKKDALVRSGSTADLDHRKLFKEGQKNLTPPVADSTRAFYESLLEENPDSTIAIKFVVEYGILPLEKHKKLLKRYNHLKD